MIERGLRPGEVVALLGDNSIELAIAALGVWTAGGALAPINKDLPADQVDHILANAGARMAVAPGGVPEHLQACPALAGDRLVAVGSQAPAAGRRVELIFGRLSGEAVFLIIYTAGSTGAPKGVQITAEALLGNERLFCEAMGVTAESRFYNILPMSYLGGLHNLLLLPMTAGASVVIDAPLGPSNLFYFWRRVRDLEIDTLWFTGAMLSMLLHIPPRGDEAWIGEQVRLGLVGMAPLDGTTRARFETRFGFRLHQNYALSETLFLTSQRPGRPSAPLGCGPLLPGVSIDLRRADGSLAGAGEDGELFIRTPHMMAGYRDAAPPDAGALQDGVFRSGDIGRFGEDGELFITGRIKDLIIRGGLNIAPSTVEAVLAACPGVREAAVVGVPDPIYGEEVAAVVAGDGNGYRELAAQALAYAAARLPPFQRPKTVDVWPALPRNHANKIDKPAIRRRLAQAASEGSAP